MLTIFIRKRIWLGQVNIKSKKIWDHWCIFMAKLKKVLLEKIYIHTSFWLLLWINGDKHKAKIVHTWRFHPYGLAFTVLESSLHANKGERETPTEVQSHRPCPWWCPECKMHYCSNGTKPLGITNQYLNDLGHTL